MYDMALIKDNNESDTTFEDIISHILSQNNVMLSVKSSGAVLETKEARFVIENNTNGRNSYGIRFFDSKGNLELKANLSGCMIVQTHLSNKDA